MTTAGNGGQVVPLERSTRAARATIEIDVHWLPADDFTQRYTGLLDELVVLAARASIAHPRYLTTGRPERQLTTIILEGTIDL